MHRFSFLFFLLLGTFFASFSQSAPEWVIFDTTTAGFGRLEATCFAEDQLGTRFVGTQAGLFRFDGQHWDSVSVPGVLNPGIDALCQSVNGGIWASWQDSGTKVGLFESGSWTIYDGTASWVPVAKVTVLLETADNLWLGSEGNGLGRFDGTNGWGYQVSNSALPSNFVSSLAADPAGGIWAGTLGGGLVRWQNGNWNVLNRNNSGLPTDTIRALAHDGSFRLYLGTDDGLVEFEGSIFLLNSPQNSAIPGARVTGLAMDRDTVWVSLEGGGLAAYGAEYWWGYRPWNSGLPSDSLGAVFVDVHGNKWVAAAGAGRDFGAAVFRERGVVEIMPVGREEPVNDRPEIWLEGEQVLFCWPFASPTSDLQVFDLQGKRVGRPAQIAPGKWSWPVGKVEAALYVLRWQNGGRIFTLKMKIQ